MARAAAIQMVSGPDVEANLVEAERLIRQAAESGAEVAVLPENFAIMGRRDSDKLRVAELAGEGPIQSFLSRAASEHGIWLVGGTIPLAGPTPERVYPACLVFDAGGRRVARYDKIHLFDVDIADSNERYRESDTLLAGDQVGWTDTPAGRLGLSVCYDLRFPELYRRLVDAGVVGFTVPAAFTAATGERHWEALLRARAIENLAYVIAAGQAGEHASGRRTWGHSMIIDPWGDVLVSLESGPGVAIAELEPETVRERRERFPSLSHRRLGTPGEGAR
ncbi:MAG TPA: carbon-nitrogen hydrolase family protein [Gammaproteobacteria bacterium]|nr:carbon-nitrogen hydrolase family protein [Gammaproteobacteria bacterium]